MIKDEARAQGERSSRPVLIVAAETCSDCLTRILFTSGFSDFQCRRRVGVSPKLSAANHASMSIAFCCSRYNPSA